MKNILKFAAVSSMALFGLMACEELPDYTTTIDAPAKLAYLNTGDDNYHTVLVTHKPNASTGEYSAEFAVHCNTSSHKAGTATLEYDASAVEAYNAENGTSYAVLPEEYLLLENNSLTLEENAIVTTDSVKVTLTGDLSALTEKYYLGAFKVVVPGLETSEQAGTFYLEVDTEISLIRPISSVDDMVGSACEDRSTWTADCSDYSNLFDGSTSSRVSFEEGDVVTVDMKSVHYVTGLNYRGYFKLKSFEYSEDGVNFEQAGTPMDGEYVNTVSSSWSMGNYYVAFYDYLKARYFRFTLGECSVSYSYYMKLAEFNIYEITSTEPEISIVGDALVDGGLIRHTPEGTENSVSATLKAMVTLSSETGYSVNAAVDNSLVETYNSANGTSYETIPTANISLTGSPATIAAKDMYSSEIAISLTGDLSSLKSENGYLIPVALSSSDAQVNADRSVYYVKVTSKVVNFRSGFTESQIGGTEVTDKSGWTIESSSVYYPSYYGQATNLIDGDASTSCMMYDRSYTNSSFTVTFDKELSLMGVYLNVAQDWYGNYSFEDMSIAVSTDGSTWSNLGTASTSDGSFVTDSSTGKGMVAFYSEKSAKYVKITYSDYYCELCEFGVYAK